MEQLDLPLLAPTQEVTAGKLRPIVAPDRFRHWPTLDHDF
jgi:hypothetical protein